MRYAGVGLIAYALGFALADLAADWYRLVVVIPAVCWIFAVRHFQAQQTSTIVYRTTAPQRARLLLLIASLFFLGSLVLLFVPQTLLTSDFALMLMGIDLLMLGISIAMLDAYDEGEALLPDALRSLALTAAAVMVFGGQVAAVMMIDGASPTLELLLFGVLTAAVIVPVAAPLAQSSLDKLIFTPQIQTERADLQAVYNALPRRDNALDLLALDEDEFVRLTRRALSYLGDLERLAASPLIHLPVIDSRLASRYLPESTLNRATELKLLLTESVERLKPPSIEAFGVSDEWRYYNALYFPYVAGLKPYRLRMDDDELDAAAQSALNWFQMQVPERTLYNWQNKAAQLIALDLRELHVKIEREFHQP